MNTMPLLWGGKKKKKKPTIVLGKDSLFKQKFQISYDIII